MKKLYIRRASELVTCRGSAPKKGADFQFIRIGSQLPKKARKWPISVL